MDITAFVVAMSIPSAITAFCFWLLERKIQHRDKVEAEAREKRQKEVDERERAREKNEIYIIKSVGAAIALGEATAKAVARIPDAHCNGDMHAALDYAQQVKHEQKDFITEQAIKAVI
ncbi:serine/threonine protein kinase [Anaerobutyricum hallii]|uniref:serine/threonine protein kinase n=1 Tax=Anaerobutyricum hallii TaxID=39488 RepID=UPI000E73A7BE|nr:serine/threonine protein kinase [Anaerobutyricum hallii]RJW30148.1 serine/threonine protein kinase [Lachnospiraceae bacterium TF09-5]